MIKIAAIFAATAFFAVGCGGAAKSTSETQALVTQSQANQAFKIVQGLDYLPFLYIEDGCYARSLYMSMELAVNGIPSSAFYVYGDLRPTSEVRWGYHVAPLLQVGNSEPYVLDPAFEKAPLRVSQWIAKDMPANGYQWEMKAGSAYFDPSGRTRQFNNNRMVQSWNEMPAFTTADIGQACSVMYLYIANQGKSAAEVSALRGKLLKRTSEMGDSLWSMRKLIDNGVDYQNTIEACGHALRY